VTLLGRVNLYLARFCLAMMFNTLEAKRDTAHSFFVCTAPKLVQEAGAKGSELTERDTLPYQPHAVKVEGQIVIGA